MHDHPRPCPSPVYLLGSQTVRQLIDQLGKTIFAGQYWSLPWVHTKTSHILKEQKIKWKKANKWHSSISSRSPIRTHTESFMPSWVITIVWRLHDSLIFPSVPLLLHCFLKLSLSLSLSLSLALSLHGDQPVLHCRSAQKHKVPLNDVIGLRQPLLPVLQGQLGFIQVMTRFLIFGPWQPSISDAQSPQPLLCYSEGERGGGGLELLHIQ